MNRSERRPGGWRPFAVVTALVAVARDPVRPIEISARGAAVRTATGEVLTAAAVDSVNTFDAPRTVTPQAVSAQVQGDQISVALPPKSGTLLSVRQTTATGFSSAPIPAIVIRTRSPGSSVNESGGTTPAPVSRITPWGKAWERTRYSTSSANVRLISPT
jgi:Alpha-L-arabinofuranosidase C-terminal domain